MKYLFYLFVSLSLFFIPIGGDEHTHTYTDLEEVVLWMNTVGPYHNRQETYSYFSLPFCTGPKVDISHYHETLGEALQGVELEFSGLDIDFKGALSTLIVLIFNSFMMVIFLVGLVFMILMRTLRKDYARYSKDEEMDDMERDLGDEYGWKQIHGDVFRSPAHPLFFSALIGTGHQLLVVALLVIGLSIVGELYTERGSMVSIGIFIYAATSPLNGYFGGSLYARLGGRRWIRQMVMSAFLLPGLVCTTAFFINFIALYYHASRTISFTIMLSVVCLCTFVILPLTLVGTVLGRNLSGQPNSPCRVNAVPRPIPEKKWFMEPWVIVPLGGVLPFGSIFIEMYFIFTSFWAYKIYYVYGFMLLVVLLLLVVVVCVTIVAAYFLLNAEDYRWQWTSFLAAASTAGYVYIYATYYFFFKTKMYGLFQTTFYFGYMALFSSALGLLCGTVGYVGTRHFVNRIYSTVKID
ncbi:Nonaspanin (TM9SF) [Trinorchestia longiramus]|nr:Nonaspanin (TM9SF) [Trinorchestia longiramus]